MSFIHASKRSTKLLMGGKHKGTKGWFIELIIFLDLDHYSLAYKEEIFSPMLFIRTFKTKDKAINLTNNTLYRLASKPLMMLDCEFY
jgi:betaine-aldehyde dehydrogenase